MIELILIAVLIAYIVMAVVSYHLMNKWWYNWRKRVTPSTFKQDIACGIPIVGTGDKVFHIFGAALWPIGLPVAAIFTL